MRSVLSRRSPPPSGEHLTGGRSSAAYAALLGLRLVTNERERALIDELLERDAGGRARPAWASAPVPEPRRAWLVSDPWGMEQVYVVGYDDPQPHQLAVDIGTSGGLAVLAIELQEPVGPQGWADAFRHPVEEIEPAQALSRIDDAARQ